MPQNHMCGHPTGTDLTGSVSTCCFALALRAYVRSFSCLCSDGNGVPALRYTDCVARYIDTARHRSDRVSCGASLERLTW